MKTRLPILAAATALVLSALAAPSSVCAADDIANLLLDPPRILRPFALQRAGARSFTKADLTERWNVVFFGYTNCPDVCPLVLNDLADGLERLGARLPSPEAPQVVFVGVDPKRDTPEVLADYVANFGPKFVGVTGEIEDVIEFERQFGAGHKYGRKTADGGYMVSHTAVIFVTDPTGRIVAKMSPPVTPELFADRFAKLHAHFEKVRHAP